MNLKGPPLPHPTISKSISIALAFIRIPLSSPGEIPCQQPHKWAPSMFLIFVGETGVFEETHPDLGGICKVHSEKACPARESKLGPSC